MVFGRLKSALVVGTALTLSLSAATTVRAQQAPPAQPAPPPPRPAATTDIIVTARRVQERLQDVPISIKVFNQAQLSNNNVSTSEELATNTPSLSADTNFGNQNTTFAIRGFVQDIGTGPSVGTYFDEVVSPRGGSNQLPIGDGLNAGTLFDLQNVQVLKGPQGTLFGLNTTGGAVLVVPQKPTSSLNGFLEAGAGNYGMNTEDGVINIPVTDKIRMRVGITHEDRDGYEKNDSGIGPSRFGNLDYTAVRASVVADITPDIEDYFVFSYSNSNENGSLQKLVGCNPNQSLANLFGYLACAQLAREKNADFYTVENPLAGPGSHFRTFQAINTTTWAVTDNVTLKNIISYAQLKDDYNTGLFGTQFFTQDYPALAPFYPKGTRVFFTDSQQPPGGDTANQSTFTEEFQVQANALDNRLTYQGGVYLELSDPLGTENGSESPTLATCTNVDTFNCANPVGAGEVGLTVGRERTKDIGVYSQATYAITDQLKLTGGARYTWDNASDGNNLISYSLPTFANPFVTPFCTNDPAHSATAASGPPNGCYSLVKESSRAPTWLIDLDYKPFDTTLLYAKYSRGYRAGGVVQSIAAPFNTYGPERVDAYEAGIKQSFLAPVHGLLDVAGFYNSFSNQQLQIGFDPKPGESVAPASGIANAGKSRIFGAEVDASITPFTGFTADVDYTYLNTQLQTISTFVTPASSPYYVVNTAIPGDPLALSPKNKVTVSGTYTLPLDPEMGKISIGASFIYTDPQLTNYADITATNSVATTNPATGLPIVIPGGVNQAVRDLAYLQARHLLNLNFTWTSIYGSPIDLTAFASNVTGEKYYTFVAGLYGTSLGFDTASLGEPTFYGFKLRYNFRPPSAPPPPPVTEAPPPAPQVVPARTYLVFFDWDRADLSARARQIVAEAATASTHVQTTKIQVNGYTDLSGTPTYNQKLSVRRAETVQTELVRDGVSPSEISIHGYGETNPLVPTAPGVREPQNRRVEIILM